MYMDIDFSISSERFLKGVRWLENELKFDKQRLEDKLKESEEKLKKLSEEKSKSDKDIVRISFEETRTEFRIGDLKSRLRLKYLCRDAEAIYVLKKLKSKLVDDFITTARNHDFWEDASDRIFDDPHTLWFLNEVGLGDNPYFLMEVNSLTKQQSVEGYIHANEFCHSGPLRVLVATKPESEALSNAVNCWLRNWKDISHTNAGTVAVGVLALTELDYEKYSSAIREEIDYLKSLQKEDGSWSFSPDYEGKIWHTSCALWAISRVEGIEDLSAQKGLKWIIERQQENGNWEGDSYFTGWALLGLLAMGEGPKMPLEFVDYQFMKLKQSLKRQKPVFIHTSPLYQRSLSIKEIYNKISDMLRNAQKDIRIASPFIDMLYEEIINLKQENPELTVKIITRPKSDVAGTRERIVRNVIDLLNIETKGNVVQSDLVHSRMIIIDDEEVLVSSADLTRDQLFDEFNAGIWTSDKETVKKAIDFFENLFQLKKEGNRRTG